MLNLSTPLVRLADQALVAEMLRHAGAHPADSVVLVGGGNADLMAELCRRGFAQVCVVVAPCQWGSAPVDLIWVPRAAPETLVGRMRGLSRGLSMGGTIVLHGDAAAGHDRVASLRRWLHTEGIDGVRRVATAGGFCLVGHKRSRPRRLLLAA